MNKPNLRSGQKSLHKKQELRYNGNFPVLITIHKLQYDLLDDAASDVVFLSNLGLEQIRNSNVFPNLDEIESLKETITSVNADASSKFLKEQGGDRLGLAIGITTRRYVINAPDFSENVLADIKNRTTAYTCDELLAILNPVKDELGKMYATKQDPTELAFLLTASAGAPIVNNETQTVDCNTEAGINAMVELYKYTQAVTQFHSDKTQMAAQAEHLTRLC